MVASWRLAFVVVAVLLGVPAAAVVSPFADLFPGATPGDAKTGPPLYAPNGYGAFPSEGSLGTHGCPFPVRLADVVAGRYAEGAMACLEAARVVDSRTVVRGGEGERTDAYGDAVIEAPDGSSLPIRISDQWWAHGTPAVGMIVVVEGVLAREDSGWIVEPVARWVDLAHAGRTVEAWEVAAGLVPEHEYVWVNRTTVWAEWRNNDGPNNIGDDHVQTFTMCPFAQLTTETTPPYFGIVTAPPMGATVRVFGATRYDGGHGWWEIHPIRAWEVLPSETALAGCPEHVGDGGFPPPGVIPDRIPPRGG